MPIYEYKCLKCNATFDFFARSIDEQPIKCPQCASKRVEKQFSSFATTATLQTESGCGSCGSATSCPVAGTVAGSSCCGGSCT
jgi:putative FmdB family regulatory protein